LATTAGVAPGRAVGEEARPPGPLLGGGGLGGGPLGRLLRCPLPLALLALDLRQLHRLVDLDRRLLGGLLDVGLLADLDPLRARARAGIPELLQLLDPIGGGGDQLAQGVPVVARVARPGARQVLVGGDEAEELREDGLGHG